MILAKSPMVIVSAIGSTFESAVAFATVFSVALFAYSEKRLSWFLFYNSINLFFSKREKRALNGG